MSNKINFIYGLWDNKKEIPEKYTRNLSRWINLNPEYQIKIWNREMIETLILDCPKWGWLLKKNITPIQYCDIARILIILRHGGVYSDLDVLPNVSLKEMNLKKGKCNIGTEFPYIRKKIISNLGNSDDKKIIKTVLIDKRSNRLKKKSQPFNKNLPKIRNNIPEKLPRISNYFFSSTPGHIYLHNCLRLISHRIDLQINKEYDIIFTTGPDIFTEVYWTTDKSKVNNIPYKKFKSYLNHQCSSSWRWESPKKIRTNINRLQIK